MNYYIQGDPARADKIKAAFERLGINVLDFGFADKTVVYCSIGGCGGCVQYIPYSINLMHILYSHPDYQELPLSVEHKFKVEDWVVFNDSHNSIYQISEIKNSYYMLTHTHGGSMSLSFSQGEFIRPWSIEDAKDGDVLATDNGWTCIFKAFDGCVFSSYCFMDSQKWFYEFGSEAHTLDSRINGNIHPATKEQRDLFFKRMKEAGYTWDKKKKELKKTPVKPQFKAGDWLWHKERGVFPVLIAGYDEERGYLAKYIGSESYFGRDATENEYRLWTINDAKDGDVLVSPDGSIIIYAGKIADNGLLYYYAALNKYKTLRTHEETSVSWLEQETAKPATKEQRDLLFAKMKESGYEWDADKKELNKIQTHYDIANFHEGMPVLVRDDNSDEWNYLLFSHYRKKFSDHFFAGGSHWCQCVPFSEDTKHLLGTTDPCDERYVNW